MKTVLVGPELEESLALRYLAGALEHAGHACEWWRSTPAPGCPG